MGNRLLSSKYFYHQIFFIKIFFYPRYSFAKLTTFDATFVQAQETIIQTKTQNEI
jgi:hypothetical protein